MSREEARQTYPYTFLGGENRGYYLISGIKIGEKAFDKMFPKPPVVIPVKPNYDRRNNYLADRQSY